VTNLRIKNIYLTHNLVSFNCGACGCHPAGCVRDGIRRYLAFAVHCWHWRGRGSESL